jgi:hypothetical protein
MMGLGNVHEASRRVALMMNVAQQYRPNIAVMLQRTSSSRHVDNRSMHSYIPAHKTIVQEVTAKAPICLIKSLFHSLVGYIDTRLSRRKGMFRSIHRNTMLVHSQVLMPYNREEEEGIVATRQTRRECFTSSGQWRRRGCRRCSGQRCRERPGLAS